MQQRAFPLCLLAHSSGPVEAGKQGDCCTTGWLGKCGAHLICTADLPAKTSSLKFRLNKGQSGQCAVIKLFNYTFWLSS